MTPTKPGPLALIGAIGLVCLSPHLGAETPPAHGNARPTPAAAGPRVPVAVARDRAEVMHELYAETLDVVHHRYFRRDGAVLPARALEDVFARIDRRSGVKARWIAVNTPAMSVDHEPKTEFERKAAAELAAGKAAYSRVEKGYYLRAGGIPLGTGCVSCHTRFSPVVDQTPRLAGLVIAIPVKDE